LNSFSGTLTPAAASDACLGSVSEAFYSKSSVFKVNERARSWAYLLDWSNPCKEFGY